MNLLQKFIFKLILCDIKPMAKSLNLHIQGLTRWMYTFNVIYIQYNIYKI